MYLQGLIFLEQLYFSLAAATWYKVACCVVSISSNNNDNISIILES